MKLSLPHYVQKLSQINTNISLNSGEKVNVYTINPELTEEEKDEWAQHIVAHYIATEDITRGASLYKISEEEYIKEYILPSVELRNGSEVSGLFGEILFSDFIEYILKCTVPRYKLYASYPGNPNQGIDIVAYKIDSQNHINDTVLYAEVKARLSNTEFFTLQKPIDEIEKRFEINFSVALDFARRRLEALHWDDEAENITRFTDSEKPCIRIKSAGLITSADSCSSNDFVGVNIHNNNKIETYVIYAKELLNLAKDLWRRACQ